MQQLIIAPAETSEGLSPAAVGATVAYALLGVVLLVVFTWIVSALFRLDFRRELLEDHNPALGLAFAGGAIAIAIIIGATILS